MFTGGHPGCGVISEKEQWWERWATLLINLHRLQFSISLCLDYNYSVFLHVLTPYMCQSPAVRGAGLLGYHLNVLFKGTL